MVNVTIPNVSPQLFKLSPFSNTYADKYTPDMIRKAYSFTDEYGGDGITVAVVTAFANVHIENDLREFSAAFGLPEPEFANSQNLAKGKSRGGVEQGSGA